MARRSNTGTRHPAISVAPEFELCGGMGKGKLSHLRSGSFECGKLLPLCPARVLALQDTFQQSTNIPLAAKAARQAALLKALTGQRSPKSCSCKQSIAVHPLKPDLECGKLLPLCPARALALQDSFQQSTLIHLAANPARRAAQSKALTGQRSPKSCSCKQSIAVHPLKPDLECGKLLPLCPARALALQDTFQQSTNIHLAAKAARRAAQLKALTGQRSPKSCSCKQSIAVHPLKPDLECGKLLPLCPARALALQESSQQSTIIPLAANPARRAAQSKAPTGQRSPKSLPF